MDSELTIAKAKQKVRQSETVKKQQTILHSAAGVDSKQMWTPLKQREEE